MPSTTPERRARWPGGDAEAMTFLREAGFKLTRGWAWLAPREVIDLTEREIDAVTYLIEEWDFGGVIELVPCARCGVELDFGQQPDGCRDPQCPALFGG